MRSGLGCISCLILSDGCGSGPVSTGGSRVDNSFVKCVVFVLAILESVDTEGTWNQI